MSHRHLLSVGVSIRHRSGPDATRQLAADPLDWVPFAPLGARAARRPRRAGRTLLPPHAVLQRKSSPLETEGRGGDSHGRAPEASVLAQAPALGARRHGDCRSRQSRPRSDSDDTGLRPCRPRCVTTVGEMPGRGAGHLHPHRLMSDPSPPGPIPVARCADGSAVSREGQADRRQPGADSRYGCG